MKFVPNNINETLKINYSITSIFLTSKSLNKILLFIKISVVEINETAIKNYLFKNGFFLSLFAEQLKCQSAWQMLNNKELKGHVNRC